MHTVSFLTRTASDLPPGWTWLGPDERARSSSMKLPHRRTDFLLGRLAAHHLLTHLLTPLLGPARYDIRAAPDGAPEAWRSPDRTGEAEASRPGTELAAEVRGFALAEAVISISHRSGVALCAGSRAPLRLGADLERIEPRTDGFVGDFFTPREVARIAAATTAAHRDELVTLSWSAKESVLKALREGLRLDTRSVELLAAGPDESPTAIEGAAAASGPDPHAPGGWAPLLLRAEGVHFAGWWRRMDSLVATVVADAPFALEAAPSG